MTRSITIEDLYQIKFLGRPRISPDGQRVAFVVTTIDDKKHAYRSSIWMVPTEGGEVRVTGVQLGEIEGAVVLVDLDRVAATEGYVGTVDAGEVSEAALSADFAVGAGRRGRDFGAV